VNIPRIRNPFPERELFTGSRFSFRVPLMKRLPLLVIGLFLGACADAQENDLSPETGKQVMDAYQAEDFDKVIDLTATIAKGSPWERVRAVSLQKRGIERFFEAKIPESIADFDAFVAMIPEQDPHHWQRGLSYYYAEEYEKGKAQFERHQTVNSQDVENAVWHFLCAVRVPGGSVEVAKKDLIPIEGDSRVPMKEVHDLFAGRGTVEAVLAAAKQDNDGILSETERNHLCYAHLYLGLYYEAIGEKEESADHIRLSAYDYSMDHYMGKTAQVHAKLRGIGPKGTNSSGTVTQ
jgi:tetratricopeptide (TPR) repeat protein